MPYWKDDKELFAIAKRELFTALVGDVLDKLGFLKQFLPPEIKPLRPDMVVIGRAMPVLESDIPNENRVEAGNPLLNKPFGLMFEALDDLHEDEVYICTGSLNPYALWGGLMTTRALRLKAAGAVVDGYLRDTLQILEVNFPAFCKGTYAQDQGPRGRVADFRIPIEWDGIRICPGDIVFGDLDGVLVVPGEVEEAAFSGAIEKGRGEKQVLKALQEGMSSADAFRKFGIM